MASLGDSVSDCSLTPSRISDGHRLDSAIRAKSRYVPVPPFAPPRHGMRSDAVPVVLVGECSIPLVLRRTAGRNPGGASHGNVADAGPGVAPRAQCPERLIV